MNWKKILKGLKHKEDQKFNDAVSIIMGKNAPAYLDGLGMGGNEVKYWLIYWLYEALIMKSYDFKAQIQHKTSNGIGIHKFEYNENDIKVKKEKKYVHPDEDSDKWFSTGINLDLKKNTPPYNKEYTAVSGIYKEYTAIGYIYEKKIYYVKCPICDKKIIIKEKQGKLLGSYTAKDYRLSC